MLTMLYQYDPGPDRWVPTPHPLDSPAPDGSVAYYQASLSRSFSFEDARFNDEVALALCRYLKTSLVNRGLELTDGPYIQVMPRDRDMPADWVMIRAVAWTEEFDHTVPIDVEAVAA